MILSPDDAQLFYKLMWGVQFYVNQQAGTFKDMTSAEAYAHLSSEKKIKVRDLLWKRPALMDDYIQANPDAFSAGELEILRGWRRYFIKGTFYIIRHLKKGTIFIGDQDKVYFVSGLVTPLDEIVPSYALPQMVQTVLLPFKGLIVYDGLFSGYNVSFGGNIRADLNRVYQVAKHKDRIITSLDPDSKVAVPRIRPRSSSLNPKLEVLTSQLAAVKGDTATQNAALALARASLDLAAAAANREDMAQHRRRVRKASTRLENLLEFEEVE
ncbi:MAG TPA: hypothetical protein VMC09_03555 [Anaerolineales bacterium]|nr:hypothetical protein [Anaerolineales bacterium]HVN81787.1 hypothetical protein [Terriglobia bacterium]